MLNIKQLYNRKQAILKTFKSTLANTVDLTAKRQANFDITRSLKGKTRRVIIIICILIHVLYTV